MTAYRTQVTIEDPARLELRNLPFRPGQHIKVILVDDAEHEQRARRWRDLFARTQALPQATQLTDEDISREIEAYRSGQ
ncbi:hypothetical protein G3480_05990 [Thiorhodococcus mannitoliphagus]|uniref:Uncharacterized protein n=1 Tax=Thiorhodococcus mannitoliphagus TaxID=329406 RepID=A0A6P1DPE9_9GAMM|nr:hypothetical protein [Thiorhodococcus mannitoliphagus]NEX19868.1 hypothetical protein [Thiorhodococcus mannitoliphagus]